ncbi:MAG TPA: SAM-dependent methyltransferase [Bacteroidales bacterium]|nr:SAM-dependent methyltransferase [Bacteroidales bacterium]
MKGKLYLIPNSLGNQDPDIFLPKYVMDKILSIKYFIVEDLRNARRFLKLIDKKIVIDDLIFFELNKHTQSKQVETYIEPANTGMDIGLLSEAGLPGIADPGAGIITAAHKENIQVLPLTGPSSIFLGLMASGLNGQQFKFHGYLPIQKNDRIKSLKQLEKSAVTTGETQIFIETPYRNIAMMKNIIETCNENTMIAIAADITLESEYIHTKTVSEWKKGLPNLHKRPAVFLIGQKQQ